MALVVIFFTLALSLSFVKTFYFRWILKPDYLTASCEAGRLLDEESYEYYSKGLTEDGAISLEAPRKWRLLRQRTGHGALYKMRIVIYGECIAPTLVEVFVSSFA